MSASSPGPQPWPEILVRDAGEEDMARIQEIYGHHVLRGLASFEEVAPDLEEIRRRRGDLIARGLPYLVAELDGQVAGFAYAGPYRARSAYRYTVEDSVYVDHRALRRGVGRALLRVLIERCAALGYRQMVAVIGDSGNDSSIGAHAAMGFQVAGRLPAIGFKLGRWVDSVLMQRPLGPGAAALPERP